MASITSSKFWSDLLKKILKILLNGAGVNTTRKSHNQHVVPYEENDWAIKGEGNSKYTEIFDTQKQAIRRAKEIARNYKADVIIHRKDGTIRDRINYD